MWIFTIFCYLLTQLFLCVNQRFPIHLLLHLVLLNFCWSVVPCFQLILSWRWLLMWWLSMMRSGGRSVLSLEAGTYSSTIILVLASNILFSFLRGSGLRNGSIASPGIPIFKIDKLFPSDIIMTFSWKRTPLSIISNNSIFSIITINDIVLLYFTTYLPLMFWLYLILVFAVPIKIPFLYTIKVIKYYCCYGDSWIGGMASSYQTDWLLFVFAIASGKKNDSSIVTFRIIYCVRGYLRERLRRRWLIEDLTGILCFLAAALYCYYCWSNISGWSQWQL